MKAQSVFLLLLSFVYLSVFAQQIPSEAKNSQQGINKKRLALVIGNSNYAQGEKWSTAVNDANDVTQALQKINFEIILSTDADKATMQTVINDFIGKLKDKEVGLVYYSGGSATIGSEQFLMPTDAHPATIAETETSCLPVKSIADAMTAVKTKIIILDSDRTNPFSERTTWRSADGIRSMNADIGFVMAYATSPGRQVIRTTDRNSLYTSAFKKAIGVPNKSIAQVFNMIREDVMKQSNYKQMPWESTSLTGDFYFQPTN